MTWFEDLFGFEERSADDVRAHLSLDGPYLVSKTGGGRWRAGEFEIPTLGDFEQRLPPASGSGLTLSSIVGDVSELHRRTENAGALFQAASQFNLLEMALPTHTPEMGVGIYQYDKTQGPACAISCGAGTVYRNYFVEIDGQTGQTADRQIDCLNDVGRLLGNSQSGFWRLQNGYAFSDVEKLTSLNALLNEFGPQDWQGLAKALRIGLQWNTEVTSVGGGHCVSQAYCSALPLGYSTVRPHLWEPLARLVLNATYKATLSAGVLNWRKSGNNRVFLTLVGGGVFGNPLEWIAEAVVDACLNMRYYDLDVQIVSYSNPLEVAEIVKRWERVLGA